MNIEDGLAEDGGKLMYSSQRNILCMVKIVIIPLIVISVFLIVAGKMFLNGLFLVQSRSNCRYGYRVSIPCTEKSKCFK